jgi:hypothetical protein
MATRYEILTCDPFAPVTRLDWTAHVVFDLLSSGRPEYAANVDAAIMRDRRARLYNKAAAFKALGNKGFAIATWKAGRHSVYQMTDDPAILGPYTDRVSQEVYSQLITTCRKLGGALQRVPGDVTLQASHQALLLATISVGGKLGKPISVVVAEAVPL